MMFSTPEVLTGDVDLHRAGTHPSKSAPKEEFARRSIHEPALRRSTAPRFSCKVDDAERPVALNSGEMSKRSNLDELSRGHERIQIIQRAKGRSSQRPEIAFSARLMCLSGAGYFGLIVSPLAFRAPRYVPRYGRGVRSNSAVPVNRSRLQYRHER